MSSLVELTPSVGEDVMSSLAEWNLSFEVFKLVLIGE